MLSLKDIIEFSVGNKEGFIEQWRARRYWKRLDKKQLELGKSHVFESWAEYRNFAGLLLLQTQIYLNKL